MRGWCTNDCRVNMLSIDVNVANAAMEPESIIAIDEEPTSINENELSLLNVIGKGMYGTVWKANLFGVGAVAVKLLEQNIRGYTNPASQQMMHREILMLHKYAGGHEGIVHFFGQVASAQRLGYVMEYMECGSLETLLKQLFLKYRIDHVLHWLRQEASAITYMHSIPIVHRDIKPLNILLSNNFLTLKLCDFGTVAEVRTTMTNYQGSAPWMAPEVFMGTKYSPACDVYSLGIVLWQMIARRQPYNARSIEEVLWKVREGGRPSQLKVHPLLMAMIERCWAADPLMRPNMPQIEKFAETLLTVYTRWKEPIEDTRHTNTPIPVSVWSSGSRLSACSPRQSGSHSGDAARSSTLTHRRAGSHETTLIRAEQNPLSDRRSPVNHPSRRHSFNMSNSRKLRSSSSSAVDGEEGEEDVLRSVDPQLRPPDAIAGDHRSSDMYDAHMARLYNLLEIERGKRNLLAKKHELIYRANKAIEMQRLLRKRTRLERMVTDGLRRMSESTTSDH